MVLLPKDLSDSVLSAEADWALYRGFLLREGDLDCGAGRWRTLRSERGTPGHSQTKELEKLGLEVVRFSNADVDKNFEGVCTAIDLKVKSRLPL